MAAAKDAEEVVEEVEAKKKMAIKRNDQAEATATRVVMKTAKVCVLRPIDLLAPQVTVSYLDNFAQTVATRVHGIDGTRGLYVHNHSCETTGG